MQLITIILFVIVFCLLAILYELMKAMKDDLCDDIKDLNNKRIADKYSLKRTLKTLLKFRNQNNERSKNTPGNH